MGRALWLGCLALAWVAGEHWSRLYADGQAVVEPPGAAVNPIVVQPVPAAVVNPPVVIQSGPITVVNPVMARPVPPLMVVAPPVDCQGPAPLPPRHRHWKPGWCRKPVGCAAAEVGCSNLAEETIFFWGSCRAFFCDSCLKEPPPPLLHRFPATAPLLSCP
jgi:hypothetical protein